MKIKIVLDGKCSYYLIFRFVKKDIHSLLFFAPDHFVDDGNVRLDDFDYDVADVFTDIDIHGRSVIVVEVHRNGCLHGLKE